MGGLVYEPCWIWPKEISPEDCQRLINLNKNTWDEATVNWVLS